MSLSEAWPNPFNPTARIALTLRHSEAVRLALYNIQGQEVALIKQADLSAGTHEFLIQGESLASGLYFVQAQSAQTLISRKVLLIK